MNNTKLVSKKVYHLNPLTGSGFWELAKKILDIKKLNSLSNFDTINIIKNLSAPILSQNQALMALAEDFSFSKELFKIFSLFKCHKITPTYLKEMLQVINIFEEDKKRFSLIIECFQKYENFLNENNYEDSTNLILKATKSLPEHNTEFIAEVVFKEFLTPLQQEFLNSLKNSGSTINYTEINSQTFENKEFYKFDNIKTEAEFICKDILKKIQEGASFSDFGLILRNSEQQRQFINEIKRAKIPLNSDIFDEKIHNFKLKMNNFLDFFTLLKKLEIPYFSFVPNKKNTKSLSEFENSMQELDSHLEELLEEILDSSQKDKLLEKKETSNKFLYQILFGDKISLPLQNEQSLALEIEFIKNLYSFFIENNFEKILLEVAKKIQEDKNQKESTFQRFLDNLIIKLKITKSITHKSFQKEIDTNIVKELLEGTFSDKEDSNAVWIGNLRSSKMFKYLYLPCFSEDNYPKKPKSIYFISPSANELISSHLKLLTKIIDTQDILQKRDNLLINYALSQPLTSYFLSYHSYQKKPLAPSFYFSNLLKQSNSTLNETSKTISSTTNYNYITPKNENFLKEEKLYLSPTSIANFLSCKRKYFYANLLELKVQSTFKASYGSIVHAILQLFGNSETKNKQTLINLADILFNAPKTPDIALDTGFEKWQVALICETDELSLLEMKENFKEAIESLEITGWFDNLPQKIETEVSFHFELKEIKDVIFDGKIDAIYEYENKVKIVDYKTGATKKRLEYYFSEDGVNFIAKSGIKKGQFDKKNVKKYDYQIPIYYLASQNAAKLNKFKDKLTKIGLNYIRPKKNDGIDYDFIESSQAENYSNIIIKNLKETVVEEIRNTEIFEPNPEMFKCQNCAYKFLCDEDIDD